MESLKNTHMVQQLSWDGKTFVLVGTAHVSRESSELVESVIRSEKPDTVCIELCASRYQTIQQKAAWQETDIIKIIREKKAFLLLSNLMLASFQKRIAKKLDIRPGEEMLRAIQTAEDIGAKIHLADRDIRTTLSRAWRVLGIWSKIKMLFQLLFSLGELDDISEDQVEQMKQEDMLKSLLDDVGKTQPVLKEILIDERDRYLAQKIKTAPGRKIVAVVGAGHLQGIGSNWSTDTDLGELEILPPASRISRVLKWALPFLILVLIGSGFFYGGQQTGKDMIVRWLLANGILSGIGALIAMAHPLTILSSVLAAPLTSLNPMIAAGWVSGLVEIFSRKPKVRDFEGLADDIVSLRGFWKNKITRVLLVVVFTNLGSTIGTVVAIPLMVKVF